jgi:heme exporter protein A
MRTTTDVPPTGAITAVVELTGVTRLFGTTAALVRADLSVERGQIVVLRGPNGAGKSTLLRILATSLSPTYGRGRVLGFDLARQRDRIRRGTELVTHATRLYDDLTAAENLRFWCQLLERDPGGIDGVLDRVGLLEVSADRVRGFSQGMRQRLAIGRAILRGPELLLLDEPFTGLDAEARHAVDDLVRDTAADGRTVVLATHHDVPFGSREIHLDGGRIVRERP